MHSVIRRLGLIGLVLLLCLAVVSPSAAAAGLVVKPTHIPSQPPTQKDPRVAQLQAAGYAVSDILTALDFEWKTGIAAAIWLQKYEEAGEWLQVALQTREMGVSLQSPWRSSGATSVDEDTRNFYQDHGYSLLEVFDAAALARDFGITMDEVFALYHDRGGMREAERYLIELAEVAVWGPTYRCAFGGWLAPDQEVLETDPKTGTTRLEVCTWMTKGYKIDDIVNAFSATDTVQATVQELLDVRQQGKDWTTIVNSFPYTEGAMIHATGLEVERLRKMVRQGFTQKDILSAVSWAKLRYQTAEEVLQEFDEKDRDWKAYQTNNPTPDNLVWTTRMPLEKILALRNKGAKPLWILIANHAAKTEGLPFDLIIDDMIKHDGRRTIIDFEKNAKLPEKDPQSYGELCKLLGLPASTEVAFSMEDFNKLVTMGFEGEEMAKVGLIALVSKRPALDVAAMKKPGMSWLDLIDQLKK